MLPRDTSKYVPEILKRKLSENADGQALVDKMDEIIAYLEDDAYQLSWIKQPERMPAEFLDLMDQYLEADFKAGDDEAQKRFKVHYAVQRHKLNTLFDDDVKIIIDTISGKNSSIWDYAEDDSWVQCGDGITGGTTYRATFGTDNIDDALGILHYTDGTQPGTAGVVLIDVGWVVGDLPVTTELAEMQIELTNHVPAYYRVFLGYEDVSGNFVYLEEVV